MLVVTKRAKEEISAMLAENIDEPGVSLRLVQGGPGEFGLVPDVEKERDEVVEHEGRAVLLIEEELSAILESITIECRDTPEGPQLVLSRSA